MSEISNLKVSGLQPRWPGPKVLTVPVPTHLFPYEEHFKQTDSSVVVGGVF